MIKLNIDNFFSDKRLDIELSKFYHKINMFIYNTIYKYLSIHEHIAFITSSVIYDAYIHTETAFDGRHFKKHISIANSFSRYSGHTEYTKIINEICKKAKSKWDKGCTIDHIDMIDSFKKHKKYADFFSKRGFEKKLNNSLKQLCREHGFKVIRGVDIASRKGRKKRPDGAGPKSSLV